MLKGLSIELIILRYSPNQHNTGTYRMVQVAKDIYTVEFSSINQ